MNKYGLFTDPDMNVLLAAAGMFPLTTGEKGPLDTPEPMLGLVDDWDADGNIYHVQKFPIIFSNN